MNETGKTIQRLRIKAGFTQRTLADTLHITDKAISKWERGICYPDISLIPKLSVLLDADVGLLLGTSQETNNWIGFIDIGNADFSRMVFDKPMVYYLLSHYLLLGITTIYVRSSDANYEFIESAKLTKYGFTFCFEVPKEGNVMMINHPWFLFGSDLTQQFQGAMQSGRMIGLEPENQEPVSFFLPMIEATKTMDFEKAKMNASIRTLGRGMICFDMDNNEKILDVASFVRTYQNNAHMLIASLEEIAFKMGIISRQELGRLIEEVPYGSYLKHLCKPEVG